MSKLTTKPNKNSFEQSNTENKGDIIMTLSTYQVFFMF